MIAFDFPLGLLLLLAIPLIYIVQRVRSVPRREVFTGGFLLQAVKKPAPRKTMSFLRLKKYQRLLLATTMLGSLILAVGGPSWIRLRPEPQRWLVIMDNPSPAGMEMGGSTILKGMRDGFAAAARGLAGGDTISVMVTSPALDVRTFGPGADPARFVEAIAASPVFPPVSRLWPEAENLSAYYDRVILLSPRAQAWREAMASSPRKARFTVPPDRAAAEGNVGLTGFFVRPSRAGREGWDIYLTAAASGPAPSEVPVILAVDGRRLPAPAFVRLDGGRGRLFLENVPLAGGVVSAELAVADAFPLDNRAATAVRASGRVKVAVLGDAAPVYRAAVETGDLFTLAPENEAAVTVYLDNAPDAPRGPALVVNPTRDQLGLKLREVVAPAGDVSWHPDHPVTAGIRDGSFRPQKAVFLIAAGDYRTLAEADGVPILWAGRHGGRKVVAWAFDPLDRGLFLKPEFVILLRESIDWLARGEDEEVTPALSLAQTLEAGRISLPGTDFPIPPRKGREKRPLDLVPALVLAALLAGALLALSDTEEES